MAERDLRDRLRPSLFDRLHEKPIHRLRPGGVMTLEDLRAAVLRNLEWLLNTTRLEVNDELAPWPEVQRSVLNFGVPDMTGATPSAVQFEILQKEIREVIRCFEPRIDPRSLTIRKVENGGSTHSNFTLEIKADILAEPLPIGLLLKTRFDFESGTCDLSESAREG